MTRSDKKKSRSLFWRLGNSPQPFSATSLAKHSRIRDAVAVDGVCPYCAVGCAQRIFVKGGQVVDIEGDERSPINQGTLCPKGANTYQLMVNPHRQTQVLYRAPFSREWELKTLDWAMERIAELTWRTREETFVERDERGHLVNSTTAIAHLGGATLDNEENYLIKKLFNTTGIISIENQARI